MAWPKVRPNQPVAINREGAKGQSILQRAEPGTTEKPNELFTTQSKTLRGQASSTRLNRQAQCPPGAVTEKPAGVGARFEILSLEKFGFQLRNHNTVTTTKHYLKPRNSCCLTDHALL